jgi:ribosomal protein S18 acetylase RimI-like enzyme
MTALETTYRLEVSAAISATQIAEGLEHLTFPSLRQRTQSQRLEEPLHAVAVTCNGEAVGLVLAHATPDESAAEIISLYVRRDHRGNGISRALLTGMERLLVRQGYKRMRLAFRSDWPGTPIVERRLRQLEWTLPEANLMLGKFSAVEAWENWQSSPVNQARLPDGLEIVGWSELSESEIGSLAAEEEGEYPGEFAPLEALECIEPLASLALRHRGRIVGWIIAHRLDRQTVQYTRLHVDPPFQRLGRGLPLLAAAIQRQIEAGIAFGVFQVRSENSRMLRLIERRLMPYLGTWTESRRSEKVLKNDNKLHKNIERQFA